MKLSIITPLYNQADFIERTIESVLNQKISHVEHIVINDGSTDRSEEVIQKYKNKIIYIKQKNNGQTYTMNRGLRIATGDIICCLNSDDILLPNSLKEVVSVFTSHPKVQWLTGDYSIIDKNDKKIETYATLYKKIMRQFPYEWMLSFGNYIAQCSTFFRRDIIKEIGLLDESVRYCMDYDYWFRIIKKYPLYVVNKKLSAFRIHPESTSGSRFKKMLEEDISTANKYIKNPLLRTAHRLHMQTIINIYSIIRHS